MYSDQFVGVHEDTLISYRASFPASAGPGGEWVVYWKVFQPRPASDLDLTGTHEAFAFATPLARAKWWRVVRKNILWTRVLPACEEISILPDRSWLDLTDDLPAQEGSAA